MQKVPWTVCGFTWWKQRRNTQHGGHPSTSTRIKSAHLDVVNIKEPSLGTVNFSYSMVHLAFCIWHSYNWAYESKHMKTSKDLQGDYKGTEPKALFLRSKVASFYRNSSHRCHKAANSKLAPLRYLGVFGKGQLFLRHFKKIPVACEQL